MTVGQTNGMKIVLKTILHEIRVHECPFKKRIRSIAPRDPILWAMENFEQISDDCDLLRISYFWTSQLPGVPQQGAKTNFLKVQLYVVFFI